MQKNCSEEKFANEAQRKMKISAKYKKCLEIFEKSVEKTKRNSVSPSAVKPNCGGSFPSRVKLGNPYFDSGKVGPTGKRKVEDTEPVKKRVKKTSFVEFIDKDKGKVERYKCYDDTEFGFKEDLKERLDANDDDCPTTEDIKQVSKEYCIKQLKLALAAEECKRNSL